MLDADIRVKDAKVTLDGGAKEWFLETLIALLMPIIKQVAQSYLDDQNMDKLPWTIDAAFEDLDKKWKQEF